MTAQELQARLEAIIAGLNQAGSVAQVFLPQYAALIAIGQAVDVLLPGLAGDVARWIAGEEPSPDEKAELARKLSVLADPNLP